MTGFVVIALTIAAVTLCIQGFMANTVRFDRRMHEPEAYWTAAMLFLLPVSWLVDVSTALLVVNAVLAVVMAAFWLQARRKEAIR